MNDFENLEKTYGPTAPYSEYARGQHITYTSAEGTQQSGTIVWVQAHTDAIGVKYVVAPDDPTGFVDFALPADVITQEEQEQEPAMYECPYCQGLHYDVNQCPLKPKPSR